MAKPKEKELTALELMIEHADSISGSVAGMPKPKRRRRAANDIEDDYDPELLDDEIVYVGPGSRAKNRAAKAAREKMANTRVRYVQENNDAAPAAPRAVPQQPNPREVESALEDLFIAGEKSGEDIVHAIKEGNAVSAKTQKALEDWLEWEKREAFKEKNRAKSDPHGNQPGAGGGGNNGPDDSANDDNGPDNGAGPDFGPEDNRPRRKRGRRYGRNRGERRGPGRNLPRRSRLPKLKGKLGLALALGATVAGGLWLKHRSQEKFEEQNAENGGVGAPDYQKTEAAPDSEAKPTPMPTAPEVQRAEEAAKGDVPTPPSATQDAAVAGASLLLAGASKKIPIIGPALGNGLSYANETQHIDADETLTDAEKAKEKKKAGGSAIGGAAGGTTGAIAGAWIGGTLGSVVPVVGTAAGAALGGLLGNILGDYFGSSVGEYVAEKITDESDKMLADGEKDRKEKMDEYNDTTAENQNKAKFPQPVIMPFGFGGMGGMPGSGGGTFPGLARAQPARRMDSKQVTDIANRAIAEGGLGSVSEQFESGGRGVGTVSTGQGDAGGVSYGKHQLATNNGSMMNFLNSPEGKPFLQRFGGLAPGTAQFNSVYKDVANTQGADFDKAQSDYITRTHYAPLVAKMQNEVGVDLTKRGAGVKELMYSTAVQYGAGTSVIANALQGKDVNGMSDEELIKTIQDYKAATTDRYFKSSSAQTQQSVATRAQNEKDVLLKVAEADRKKKAVNNEQLPSDVAKPQQVADGHKPSDYRPPETDTQRAATPEALADARRNVRNEQFGGQEPTALMKAPEVNRIEPVVQPEAPVDRQPLVTEGDIARTEAPAAPAPSAPPAPVANQPKGGAVSRPAASGNSGSSPAAGHSLDSIPIFMDDPMLNMITMGYM
ncbi:hypothetical protein pEaSNUABM22_00133 [Erwinia phage pEa_SNUABM_22]|uniref:Type VI secretion system spike protein VgrG3-like C-terminal domain-containing protein n=1 Tax=Erwinia phage pEa_SNUABM_22 TaxID=2869549 RepID=A0AAE8XR50_9CAUD|nr:hypothetical protein MPK63_gp132 [Erwinia phage pEa_SNUABM_22]UAW96620.1 hypothetical protein pEaSNUABM22_00133 [Erwinia phage pEa_SNUABM_22]